MDTLKTNNKLSWKRFIPFAAFVIGGAIFICTGHANADVFKIGIYIVDTPKRNELIYFIGLCVGIFHYYHNGRKSNEYGSAWANILFGFSKSVFSAIGYSLVVNKAMNVGVGLLKELFGEQKFFIDSTQVDMLSLGLIVLLIIFIGIWEMWIMFSKSIFEVSHKVEIPISDTKRNREERE